MDRWKLDSVRGHSFNTYAKFSKRTNISYPLIRTRTCVYQGTRNVSFSENCACVLNERSLTNWLNIFVYVGSVVFGNLILVVIQTLKISHRFKKAHIRLMVHSYKNQSINLHCKSIDWFLYKRNIGRG